MNLDEIKAALAAGKRVFWGNPAYEVVRDSTGDYRIACSLTGSRIGLTWGADNRLNGKPEEFYAK